MRTPRTIAGLLVLVLALAPAAAGASTLRAILVIQDDYDDPGLNSIAPSARMDYGYVSTLLDTLEKKGVIEVEKTLLQGSVATREGVAAAVSGVEIEADDVLFFYFSGHGGMHGGETYMATSEGGMLMRGELEALVEARQARLGIIISDVCSSSIDALGPKAGYVSTSPEALESAYTQIYRNLFLNHEGLFHVTAATEGQFAWGGSSGGNFTQSLIYETLLGDPKMTWDEVYEQARDATEEKFAYMINMGLISPQALADVMARGITNQTPRAYSLPVLVGTVAIDEEAVEGIEAPASTPDAGLAIRLENETWKKVWYYIDGNRPGDVWQWDRCSEHSLGHGKTAVITSTEPVVIFFDNAAGQVVFYSLDEGSYVFDYGSDEALAVFEKASHEPDTFKKGGALVGSWYHEVWIPGTDSTLVSIFTFSADGTLSLTDLSGGELLWGRWKSKVKKHVEIVTLVMSDGQDESTHRAAIHHTDADTVMLAPLDGGEVVMLYRVPGTG